MARNGQNRDKRRYNNDMKKVKRFIHKFFSWYERHYAINVGFSAFLLGLQLFHLYWLTTSVVAQKLFGGTFFEAGGLWIYLMVLIDYTEIPALVSTSLIYINELRKSLKFQSFLYLVFLNSQWLHLFWITDEFVVNQFRDSATILPFWLALVAIIIDYLELPVILDTFKRFFKNLSR